MVTIDKQRAKQRRAMQSKISMAHQGDSHAAPLLPTEGAPITVLFTSKEFLQFNNEINRLTLFSCLCRIVGSRPKKGEVRDLIEGGIREMVGK